MTAQVFIPLQKADMAKRQVWGVAALEQVDSARPPEIMDYVRSKPRFMQWSEAVKKSSGGKSLGNVRVMHGGQMLAVGRVIHFEPRDVEKSFYVGVEVVDDAAWEKVAKGVYTGFSIGGSYGERWPDALLKGATRYEAIPNEISLVDLPCIPGATYEVIKLDGASELRKFAQAEQDPNKKEATGGADNTQLEEDAQTEASAEDATTDETTNEQETPESAPESGTEGTAPEPKQAGLSADAVKSLVISMLMELGLVQQSGAQPMAMSIKIENLGKALQASVSTDQLNKALENKAGADQLEKTNSRLNTVVSDLAQVISAVQVLEKRGGPGPVVRDLGVISQQAMAEMQKAAVLKDMLPNSDPLTRQSLEAEITRLEIKAAQTRTITNP
jgi:hypothetical protein